MSTPMPPSELAAMVDRLAPQITPGPWEWHNSDNPDNRYFIAEHGHMCIAVEPEGSDYRDADPETVALVPYLMAENQRMRRELEERVRVWGKVANKLESVDHMSNAEVVRHHIGQLTRILKGES